MERAEIIYTLKMRGVTLRSIAKQLGVHPQHVSAALSSKYVSYKIRKHIADILGKDVLEIWPYKQNTPASGHASGESVGADASIVSGAGVVSQGNCVS